MSNYRLHLALAFAAMFLASFAFGCMWDSDTLLQERSRFPDTLELITGKFLRHSVDFYQWRIRDRLQKISNDPYDLASYDDLAVAYDKTGQHQQAIDTMLEKDKRKPGLYETEANLGTFYIHAGQLEKGLEHIGRAIEINPDAHFGREKYQKLFVEYVLSRRQDGKTPQPLGSPDRDTDFTAFLLQIHKKDRLDEVEANAAIKGILGMMRFGNYESPVLLEALGNLLGSQKIHYQDAKRLAARAYLKASYMASNETAKQQYRGMAKEVLTMQLPTPVSFYQGLPLEDLEVSFRQELAEAKQWYDSVREDELAWIRDGKDPEVEFVRKYYQDPQVATHWGEGLWAMSEANKTVTVIIASLFIAGLYILVRKWRKHRLAVASRGEPL